MSLAAKNLVVVGFAWASWLVIVGLELWLKPNLWLQVLSFATGIALLGGCLFANMNAFPSIRSDSGRLIASATLGLVIAVVAGVLGIVLAVNFKGVLGGDF